MEIVAYKKIDYTPQLRLTICLRSNILQVVHQLYVDVKNQSIIYSRTGDLIIRTKEDNTLIFVIQVNVDWLVLLETVPDKFSNLPISKGQMVEYKTLSYQGSKNTFETGEIRVIENSDAEINPLIGDYGQRKIDLDNF